MKNRALLVLAFLIGTSAFAHQTTYTHHAQVVDPDKQKLRKLTQDYPELIVDHVNSLGYEIYGDQRLGKILQSRNLKFVPVNDLAEKANLAEYPTPEQIIQKMVDLQKRFPKLISLIEIGKSGQGRPLVFAKVTSQQNNNSLPEFKYVANMHGDEIVGRELMIRFIEDLANSYGKDSRTTRLLDSVQVYIMPSMNPDGAAAKVRFNSKGADLNRSFPDFTTSDNQNRPDGRQPEVQAMMKFQAQHHFKLSANFHGGSEVVNYPWDTQAALFPLDNLVKALSLDYSRLVPYIYNSTEFKQGITNGYQWYQIQGGMQDWSYYWHKDLQVTIELSRQKWPNYSMIEQYYQANKNALISYIEDIAKF